MTRDVICSRCHHADTALPPKSGWRCQAAADGALLAPAHSGVIVNRLSAAHGQRSGHDAGDWRCFIARGAPAPPHRAHGACP
jgi:hypothetical protein